MIEEVEIDFQMEFSRDVFGAFWLTYERIENKPTFFYPLNYYFEGLLYDFIQTPSPGSLNPPKKNLFIGKNFEKNVFLCHLTISKDLRPSTEANDVLKSVNPFRDSRKEILLLNGTRDQFLGSFKTKFKDYNFKEIFLN